MDILSQYPVKVITTSFYASFKSSINVNHILSYCDGVNIIHRKNFQNITDIKLLFHTRYLSVKIAKYGFQCCGIKSENEIVFVINKINDIYGTILTRNDVKISLMNVYYKPILKFNYDIYRGVIIQYAFSLIITASSKTKLVCLLYPVVIPNILHFLNKNKVYLFYYLPYELILHLIDFIHELSYELKTSVK